MAKRHISIPVNEEQADMLSQMAMEQGESLASFVRGRIFARDRLEDEFLSLRNTLLAAIGEGLRNHTPPSNTTPATAPNTSTAASESPMGLLLEILLLLRSLTNPTKVQAVRAEIERLGHKTYG